MGETEAKFNKSKAIETSVYNESFFHLLLALYEQNETIIELLKKRAN
jgi:hypothetical protein